MIWKTSLVAALSLTLAACGGGRSYADYGAETAGGQGSLAAQSWGGGAQRDPYARADAAPAPRGNMVQPQYRNDGAPGAAYAAPGDSRQPQQAYYTPPQRAPEPMPQDYSDPAAGAEGPSGSSRSGEKRYDEVGYAGIRPVSGGGAADGAVVAVHRSLPVNSFAEVTALDSGKTILVLITGTMEPGADHPMDLSAGAARQLGDDGPRSIPVRVRAVVPTPSDQAALNQGRPAESRPDTPPVLLNALRKHLPADGFAAAPPPQPSYGQPSHGQPSYAQPSRTVTTTRTPVGAGLVVQVAALSNARNAQSLAQSLGGFVKPGGGLYRVQLGPFATRGEAEAARRRAAGAGYGDARVIN
ncbi:SPOR domain-containing protein [Sphingomonas soli]|uniref:SPOR domain-containing protein n=1 Tax=Sphingomonas soli TaxID=266127 RepID=UPI0008318997|nr:SPOR domain-containing protein [Sphingomonas soli]